MLNTRLIGREKPEIACRHYRKKLHSIRKCSINHEEGTVKRIGALKKVRGKRAYDHKKNGGQNGRIRQMRYSKKGFFCSVLQKKQRPRSKSNSMLNMIKENPKKNKRSEEGELQSRSVKRIAMNATARRSASGWSMRAKSSAFSSRWTRKQTTRKGKST